MDLEIYNRQKKEVETEHIVGKKYLQWLYYKSSGNFFLEKIVKRKLASKFYGVLKNRKGSKRKIRDFIEENKIAEEEFLDKVSEYKNFNEFFYRKLKPEARPVNSNSDILVSPADGRVFIHENIQTSKIVEIKGMAFNLAQLVGSEEAIMEYDGGTMIIVRLNPSDYHRFHFPDSGVPEKTKEIKGAYYSVNTGVLDRIDNIYLKNKRTVTEFESDNFGKILYMEVGATFVGTIIQTFNPGQRVEKGAEKGYFKFGGSTVILFLKKGILTPDNDILEYTKKKTETLVKMGESLGKAK
ncbi:MAG: phosphatidylserine decarboxylase [Eubacteriales bacterium]|nr:phosphatidylserine decarboxylase [Eubacteriales bacterium]